MEFNSAHSSEECASPALAPAFVRSTEHFTCYYQGVSHAERPKDKHEYAPTETGMVTCWPLTAVAIECAPPRITGLSQWEKKL
jgi:hypothetical protein